MGPMDPLVAAADVLRPAERILVFTGAGISTESGIPDFRGPDGLWTKVDPADFTIDRYIGSREIRVRSWKMHQRGELCDLSSRASWVSRSWIQRLSGPRSRTRRPSGSTSHKKSLADSGLERSSSSTTRG